uniref:Uncharacterized protein n=1 Tax=Megaselia scalaris TaxID=36166 RepID=T1GHX8_MEGSC
MYVVVPVSNLVVDLTQFQGWALYVLLHFTLLPPGLHMVLVFQVATFISLSISCPCRLPHCGSKPANLAEINEFRFQMVTRGGVGYVHLRRFFINGLLLAATFRKPTTYPQKLIHSYDPSTVVTDKILSIEMVTSIGLHDEI